MAIVRTDRHSTRLQRLAPVALAACLVLAGGCVAAQAPDESPRSNSTSRTSDPATQAPEPEGTRVDQVPSVKLTILFDNNPPTGATAATDPPLQTGWGFACLVERGETMLLFDTGGDAAVLRNNLRALDIEPARIDVLVLSHNHSDHTGGLDAVLESGATPQVFVPSSFPAALKSRLVRQTSVTEVTGPTEVTEGMRSTGDLGDAVVEQSLIVETGEGLVVITGCAHPGIVKIVRIAARKGDVGLVTGGFHMRDEGDAECAKVVAEIESLGVARVAPTHCTGDAARRNFAAVFGDSYVPAGVGTVIEIPAHSSW